MPQARLGAFFIFGMPTLGVGAGMAVIAAYAAEFLVSIAPCGRMTVSKSSVRCGHILHCVCSLTRSRK